MAPILPLPEFASNAIALTSGVLYASCTWLQVFEMWQKRTAEGVSLGFCVTYLGAVILQILFFWTLKEDTRAAWIALIPEAAGILTVSILKLVFDAEHAAAARTAAQLLASPASLRRYSRLSLSTDPSLSRPLVLAAEDVEAEPHSPNHKEGA